MKRKTSIALSENLLKAMRQFAQSYKNRSEFIEAAIWDYIKQRARRAQNARDLEIINRRADALNAEAADFLEFQVESVR